MSAQEHGLAARALELRQAFDRSFAQREAARSEAQLELLLIRVRGHGYAVRLSQVLSLHADRKLVLAPSPRPDLLGLLGVRGQVAPVYDLGQLLGYGPGPAMRWSLLVRASAPFGLAFEHFDAHVRVSPDALVAVPADAETAPRLATASITREDGSRHVIDLSALIAEMTGSGRQHAPEQGERR